MKPEFCKFRLIEKYSIFLFAIVGMPLLLISLTVWVGCETDALGMHPHCREDGLWVLFQCFCFAFALLVTLLYCLAVGTYLCSGGCSYDFGRLKYRVSRKHILRRIFFFLN